MPTIVCRRPSDVPRTLHPLVLPTRLSDPVPAERLRRGLFVDTETTGFDPQHDTVIELALLPFTYTLEGRIVEVFHDAAQTHRNDPGRSLSPQIVALTGLDDHDVRGASVDGAAANALIAAADLIVAHNAAFDRPFVESVLPAAANVAWGCSLREVPWTEAGFASAALHCLACAYGVYARDRHRALADCEVGVWLLARRLPHTGEPVLTALRRRASAITMRLWAVGAPFEARGVLKARGYRWMPAPFRQIPRSWWTEVAPEHVDAEINWLAEHAYHPFGASPPLPNGLPQRRVTAWERWRTEPPAADAARVRSGVPNGQDLH